MANICACLATLCKPLSTCTYLVHEPELDIYNIRSNSQGFTIQLKSLCGTYKETLRLQRLLPRIFSPAFRLLVHQSSTHTNRKTEHSTSRLEAPLFHHVRSQEVHGYDYIRLIRTYIYIYIRFGSKWSLTIYPKTESSLEISGCRYICQMSARDGCKQ